MKRILIAVAATLCVTSVVNALSVNSYRNEKNEEMKKLNTAYLTGAKDGILAVNRAMDLDGKKPYFCLPDNSLRSEETQAITLQEAEKSHTFEYMPVWAVLFEGLKDRFPCNEPNK
jgi:hypothetical protein